MLHFLCVFCSLIADRCLIKHGSLGSELKMLLVSQLGPVPGPASPGKSLKWNYHPLHVHKPLGHAHSPKWSKAAQPVLHHHPGEGEGKRDQKSKCCCQLQFRALLILVSPSCWSSLSLKLNTWLGEGMRVKRNPTALEGKEWWSHSVPAAFQHHDSSTSLQKINSSTVNRMSGLEWCSRSFWASQELDDL